MYACRDGHLWLSFGYDVHTLIYRVIQSSGTNLTNLLGRLFGTGNVNEVSLDLATFRW